MTTYADRRDWLPDYLLDVRFLLHDPSGDYFPDTELVSYINEARVHTAVDTGCLRKRLTITLPAGLESYPIGGVYNLVGTIPVPVGGTAPYKLVSGAGATGTANTTAVPLTVSITAGGSYYQPPLVSFDSGTPLVNISAMGTSLLGGVVTSGPAAVSGVFVNYDNGAYQNNSITPSVVFQSVGEPATVQDDGTGNLELVTYGAGQSNGVVILDAAGVVTTLTPSQVQILDSRIAAIDQMTCVWGSLRIAMRNYAYTDFNVLMRSLVGYQQVPTAFSVVGDTLYIGPIPNNSYSYELDCIMYPNPLLDYTTIGGITDRSAVQAVKYYAAYRARISQNEEQAAQAFLELYQREALWGVNRFTTRHSVIYPDNENLY